MPFRQCQRMSFMLLVYCEGWGSMQEHILMSQQAGKIMKAVKG